MKLHLPKVLLSAVCAGFIAIHSVGTSQELDYVVLNTMNSTPSGMPSFGAHYLIEGKNIRLDLEAGIEWNPNPGGPVTVNWNGEEGASYTLSGQGIIASDVDIAFEESGSFTIGLGGWNYEEGTYVIESEIGFRNYTISTAANLEFKGTLDNSELEVSDGATADLSLATLRNQSIFHIGPAGTMKLGTMNISGSNILSVWAEGETATLDGNLVLNGRDPGITQEMRYAYEDWYNGFGGGAFVEMEYAEYYAEGYAPLTVTGSITIMSDTMILFTCLSDEETVKYQIPSLDEALFICSEVDENSLSKLKPYAGCDVWSMDGDDEYSIKPIDNREFYALTNEGRVYIYLGEKGSGGGAVPDTPITPGIVAKPGDEVVLGGESGMIPSVQNPVQMHGGSVDASHLDGSLLNNKVIIGNSGILKTGSNQTMTLSGSGGIGYSVIGVDSNSHGANLEISTTSNLTLEGEKYAAAITKVNSGNVTISGTTTLGTDAANDILDLTGTGVGTTNFGTIAAGVKLGKESNLLNQGKVLGAVSVGSGSSLLNNGEISGLVDIAKGGSVYGSGAFAETQLGSGALLHVGNSPGYQKHTCLTISRGATLSFSVDGDVPASMSNKGSGTYSVLDAGTLTIQPGSGIVTVNVEVTMGIVSAGTGPMSLTLINAESTNAKESDFALHISDKSKLLEEGATLSFDAATGSFVLNASVSKAALAALMDSNAANVANTMWASANAVQEMARTAEHQFLVGMPGQTTFWGAAMGSFMNVSGDHGFTSNMGGYAVGLQHAFTQEFRAGFALGQSFGDFKSDDNQLKVDQEAIMPTLTAQYVAAINNTSSLSVSGHIAYGEVSNEAESYQAGAPGTAEWNDQVFNIGIRAAWNTELTDNTTLSVFTGVTYQNVEQDSFTEKYTGGERDYHSGSMSSLSLPLGVTLRGIYQMEGTNIFVPELTLSYIGDVVRDNPEVKTSVYGFNRVGKGTEVGRSAFMLNAGANWMFDSTWSVGAFYSLEARSHQVNQSVNAALRCCF